MRDPNRLDKFYEELKRVHKEYVPDWRFGQFMYNFFAYTGDPFFFEENKLIEKLHEYVKERL